MKYKAICIDNSNTNLILYKKYMIEYANYKNNCVHVFDKNSIIYNHHNDGITITIFSESKFQFVNEFRNNRINKLINGTI